MITEYEFLPCGIEVYNHVKKMVSKEAWMCVWYIRAQSGEQIVDMVGDLVWHEFWEQQDVQAAQQKDGISDQ